MVGLSNSATQKLHIDTTAKARGLANVEVIQVAFDLVQAKKLKFALQIITADVNTFNFDERRWYVFSIPYLAPDRRLLYDDI